ncbi:MAG: hypothetical protein QCI00_08635 [Candidatus Thermoplasmatota archaeon]|nr:hypothetical protein [Candidatus Thermoplasmatota archaeon]
METLNWIGFNKQTLPIILEKLELEVDNNQIIDPEIGRPAFCECCSEAITNQNIGAIVPGSKRFYCKKTKCFMNYMMKDMQ